MKKTDYNSALDFVRNNAEGNRIVIGQNIHNHRWLKPLNIIEKYLSVFWPNLFVNVVVFYISKSPKNI